MQDFKQKKLDNKFYSAWLHMRRRCNDPKHMYASRYSARGIGYDSRWESFDKFYEDMINGYVVGLSLDRIDNNKGYSAENCRWATRVQQCNNRSSNRLIKIDGTTKTLAEWIRLSSVKSSTVRQRFYVYNWSIKKALEIN